jgi:hypothetical protein
MRLLNARTKKLEQFFDKSIPKYAILSHTWGENEVTLRDFDPLIGPRKFSTKISGCCAQTLEDGFDYVWIDTCCIDKSSSAELSEAINSMFAWYARAEICYVYLSDVDNERSDMGKSRWFSRGWTLQELLAPPFLTFYDVSWDSLGSLYKGSLRRSTDDFKSSLETITNIPSVFIDGSQTLDTASIAMRMSWASGRQTTRVEDMAYCLLGIFGVAMPMIYGEGTKAFMRLQEEIMKNEDYRSIFAWGFNTVGGGMSCFASSPADFAGCGQLYDRRSARTHSSHILMTNKGLNITMSIIQLYTGDYIGELKARGPDMLCLAIPLVGYAEDEDVFYRPSLNVPTQVHPKSFKRVDPKPIYISRSVPKLLRWNTGIRLSSAFLKNVEVTEVHPANWDLSAGCCLKGLFEDFQREKQTILLGCRDKKGDKFAIRVDYTFEIASQWNHSLSPKETGIFASPFRASSLLELMVVKGERFDEIMAWQKDVVLKDIGTSVGDGENCSGYSWRVRLDQSRRHEWEIDLVDVANP